MLCMSEPTVGLLSGCVLAPPRVGSLMAAVGAPALLISVVGASDSAFGLPSFVDVLGLGAFPVPFEVSVGAGFLVLLPDFPYVDSNARSRSPCHLVSSWLVSWLFTALMPCVGLLCSTCCGLGFYVPCRCCVCCP